MAVQQIDAVRHAVNPGTGTQLAGAAVSTTTAGTIAGTTAAGAAPTVAIPTGFVCNDRAGTFELTAVTGGGAQAAGDVCTVRFLNEYAATPAAVVINFYDNDTTDLARVAAATAVTTAGFNINVPAVLVTAHAYRISYVVIPGGTPT